MLGVLVAKVTPPVPEPPVVEIVVAMPIATTMAGSLSMLSVACGVRETSAAMSRSPAPHERQLPGKARAESRNSRSTSATVESGHTLRSSATAPATCGAAMLVPYLIE